MKVNVTYMYTNLNPQPIEVNAKVNLKIDRLSIKNISTLCQVRTLNEKKLAQFKKRFDRKDICYVAMVDNIIVNYSWVALNGKHYVEPERKSVDILPGDIWIYDCVTNKDYRGLNIYPAVLGFILRKYVNSNIFIYTTKKNIASQKGISKAGFSLIYKKITFYYRSQRLSIKYF